MYVDLNGQLVAGELQVTIPAGGLRVLETDGQGTLKAGSLEVSSDRPLAGVVLFGGDAGVAGVGSGEALIDGFVAAVETSSANNVNTGVAILNLEDEEVTASLALTDINGIELTTAEIVLNGRGHRALFVDQFEWSDTIDFANFLGLLRVVTTGRVAATVIQTRPGQFATMPVAPIATAPLTN